MTLGNWGFSLWLASNLYWSSNGHIIFCPWPPSEEAIDGLFLPIRSGLRGYKLEVLRARCPVRWDHRGPAFSSGETPKAERGGSQSYQIGEPSKRKWLLMWIPVWPMWKFIPVHLDPWCPCLFFWAYIHTSSCTHVLGSKIILDSPGCR